MLWFVLLRWLEVMVCSPCAASAHRMCQSICAVRAGCPPAWAVVTAGFGTSFPGIAGVTRLSECTHRIRLATHSLTVLVIFPSSSPPYCMWRDKSWFFLSWWDKRCWFWYWNSFLHGLIVTFGRANLVNLPKQRRRCSKEKTLLYSTRIEFDFQLVSN